MTTRYQFQCKGCDLGPCNLTCPDTDMTTTEGDTEIPASCPWAIDDKVDWKLKRRPTE